MLRENNWMARKLRPHFGHKIACVCYGDPEVPSDICIECEDCNEVLVSSEDFNERPGQKTVVEWCPHCEFEVEMVWDVKAMGFKAFCPVCGERLMLCDECHHRDDGSFHDDCDYDSIRDTCRFNPIGSPELKFLLKFVVESNDNAQLNDPSFAFTLRALWTAFCHHEGLDCDTARYDSALMRVWAILEDFPMPKGCYADYHSFDLFMGEYLC